MATPKKNRIKDWKTAAKRTILGPKEELETLPGYWIKPRKYSVEGKDAIGQASIEAAQSIDKKLLTKIQGKMQENIEELENPSQVLDLLSEEEFNALLDAQAKGSSNSRMLTLVLKYGIGEHNFEGEPNDGVSDQFITDLLEFDDIAMEMQIIIQSWNAAPKKKNSSNSKKRSGGSSMETSSQRTENQDLTGADQQKS